MPWLSVDWSAHQRWLALSNGPVNVIDIGEGPAVLFIHGLGGCWANWLQQLPVIADSHRAIALDLPGFGASPPGRVPISIDNYVATVFELMDVLELPTVALVGNSMGGLIAAELTAGEQQRVRSLALISPAGFPLGIGPGRVRLLRGLYPLIGAAGRQVAGRAEQLARRPRLRDALIGTVAARPRSMAVELAAEQLRGMGKPGLWPAFLSLIEHELDEQRLAAINCPTLIIWGDHDRVVPTRHAELYTNAIPGARKVIFPDIAHVAMLECPAEVNELLLELIDGEQQPQAADAATEIRG